MKDLKCKDLIGEHGVGERNVGRERLVEYIQEKEMVVTNTLYKLRPNWICTWKSPQVTDKTMVRNKIDYVMIGKSHRNCKKSPKTYAGADITLQSQPCSYNIQTNAKMDQADTQRQ